MSDTHNTTNSGNKKDETVKDSKVEEDSVVIAVESDNYDMESNSDCSEECITEGCTDPEALNYDIGALDDDGSCIYK
tara:strand:+ start:249 stop:479 length:231 start_codon:yes stop_codon:yes gene_type:complete